MLFTPHPIRRPRTGVTALVALVAVLASVVPVVATAAPASAATITAADFAGRGWGHGRGMSQFGAYGYARDRGWSTEAILGHYYGGTKASTVAQAGGVTIDPNFVRVRLMYMNDQLGTLVGTSSGSTLSITGAGDLTIPSDAKAVRMIKAGDIWNIDTASSCDGPWTALGQSTGRTVTIGRSSGSDELFVCRPDRIKAFYSGSIRAQLVGDGTRTMNITTIEEYLRGVVPREMPASWHPAALRAQAVTARSYAMAGDTRHADPAGGLYADTCDTTLCQVYKGRFEQQPGSAKVAMTDTRTDAAIAATAGVVRAFTTDNRIARTEFSSTSGGWTAGGTFPAVEDLGDSISPLHTWTAETVSLAPLSSLGTGNLTGIAVTKRNGLGADGGRVLEVRLDFDGQSSPVLVSGDTVRSRLGLRSNWYTISVQGCSGTEVGDYIDSVYQLFLDRPVTSREQIQWCDKVVTDSRKSLTSTLSVSDEWAGVQIDDLYKRVLGRNADASGRAYWLDAIRQGRQLEDIAPGFYGSEEYFNAVSRANDKFVNRLYVDILGRQADAAGAADWTRQLDTGRRGRRDVSSLFYRSAESRRDRVIANYRTILLRAPDPGGLDFWRQALLKIGEIELTADLAASQEYYNRVTRD